MFFFKDLTSKQISNPPNWPFSLHWMHWRGDPWTRDIVKSFSFEMGALFHDQDTIRAEKRCADMHNFCMAALVFLTLHGMKARTHDYVEIAHFPTQCIIRTWKVLGLWPRVSQALVMHQVGRCAISTWAWVLAIISCQFHTIMDCDAEDAR